ncbi:hypothetical protein NPIL_521961 [Nephila pilipes]|uniref:Uncharacterized protein n=1 Tax=Nephila pilipes TaxID=299642 RepID=A0A8X6N063_NEPPI|nr:hypothetical protein NPIL_521961 [Nephila pilipes]
MMDEKTDYTLLRFPSGHLWRFRFMNVQKALSTWSLCGAANVSSSPLLACLNLKQVASNTRTVTERWWGFREANDTQVSGLQAVLKCASSNPYFSDSSEFKDAAFQGPVLRLRKRAQTERSL